MSDIAIVIAHVAVLAAMPMLVWLAYRFDGESVSVAQALAVWVSETLSNLKTYFRSADEPGPAWASDRLRAQAIALKRIMREDQRRRARMRRYRQPWPKASDSPMPLPFAVGSVRQEKKLG